MDIATREELAERAWVLNETILDCITNIKENFVRLGFLAAELKAGKLYRLLMPEAKTWEMFVSAQPWGLKRAQVDNYSQVALLIGVEIKDKDIPLNRALDITRIVNRLPSEEQKGKIEELIASAEVLPKIGWDDTIKKESGRLPSDECTHEFLEPWSRCKNPKCGKFFKL